MRRWLCVLVLEVVVVCAAVAQSAAPTAAFEVASVRQSKRDAPQHTNVPLDAGNVYGGVSADDTRSAAGGYLIATHQPLWRYITFAYQLSGTQELSLRFNLFSGVPKSGAPFWVTGGFDSPPEYFDVSARAPEDSSMDDMRRMMRTLLEERFRLKVHMMTADAPVFALVLVQPGVLGPALHVHAAADACKGAMEGLPGLCGVIAHVAGAGAGLHEGGRGVPLSLFATSIPTMTGLAAMPRPVVDRTGLQGLYDFTLTWEHDGSGREGAVDENASNFREALKKQLGLELKPSRAPMEFLMVDHVERPTEN